METKVTEVGGKLPAIQGGGVKVRGASLRGGKMRVSVYTTSALSALLALSAGN